MTTPASQAASYIANQPSFNLRCQLMAMQYAINVVLQESPGVTDHVNRAAFSAKVINGVIGASLLARVVLTDTAIQAIAVADLANDGAAVADTGVNSIDGRLQAIWTPLANALV